MANQLVVIVNDGESDTSYNDQERDPYQQKIVVLKRRVIQTVRNSGEACIAEGRNRMKHGKEQLLLRGSHSPRYLHPNSNCANALGYQCNEYNAAQCSKEAVGTALLKQLDRKSVV